MREREIGIARSQEGGRDEIISAIVVVVVCVIVGRHGSFPINHVEHLPSVENGKHHDASDHIMEYCDPRTGKQRLLIAHHTLASQTSFPVPFRLMLTFPHVLSLFWFVLVLVRER